MKQVVVTVRNRLPEWEKSLLGIVPDNDLFHMVGNNSNPSFTSSEVAEIRELGDDVKLADPQTWTSHRSWDEIYKIRCRAVARDLRSNIELFLGNLGYLYHNNFRSSWTGEEIYFIQPQEDPNLYKGMCATEIAEIVVRLRLLVPPDRVTHVSIERGECPLFPNLEGNAVIVAAQPPSFWMPPCPAKIYRSDLKDTNGTKFSFSPIQEVHFCEWAESFGANLSPKHPRALLLKGEPEPEVEIPF